MNPLECIPAQFWRWILVNSLYFLRKRDALYYGKVGAQRIYEESDLLWETSSRRDAPAGRTFSRCCHAVVTAFFTMGDEGNFPESCRTALFSDQEQSRSTRELSGQWRVIQGQVSHCEPGDQRSEIHGNGHIADPARRARHRGPDYQPAHKVETIRHLSRV